MRQQVKESVATERAHCQGHQEGEQELEAGLLKDGHKNNTQQRQQADDGDGHKAPDPDQRWREKNKDRTTNERWVLFTLGAQWLFASSQDAKWLFSCKRIKKNSLYQMLSWFLWTNSHSFPITWKLAASIIHILFTHGGNYPKEDSSVHVSLWWHNA